MSVCFPSHSFQSLYAKLEIVHIFSHGGFVCLFVYLFVFFFSNLWNWFMQSQWLQGFDFENGRGALNCSPERFKESCQESDSYEHH